MKCPECGVWSEVKETRAIYNKQAVRRGRKCANGHSFSTYEIGPNLFSEVVDKIDTSGFSPMELIKITDRIKRERAKLPQKNVKENV